jgi:hypothetical protein
MVRGMLRAARMRSVCRLAPALTILSLAGCYASHGGPGGAGVDAGTAADVPLDPSCGPRRVDAICLDHVRAGVATEITVPLGELEDTCFCDQDIRCDTAVVRPGTLALTTYLCPELPVCRACAPSATGRCTLPPLTAGTWQVEINGARSLELTVVPADVLPERADVCIRRAIDDGCGTVWPATTFDVSHVCHEASIQPGERAHLRIHDACGGCMLRGPCEVTVVDGFIRARATRMPSGCDLACPPGCFDDEHVCITPPLAEGEYRVIVEGLAVDESTTIRVEAGADGGEACAG